MNLCCSSSFARPKENEPKVPFYGMPYSGKKDAPRKFFTSRACPSADDSVPLLGFRLPSGILRSGISPACLPTTSTESFTAPTDGTTRLSGRQEFSQGVISAFVRRRTELDGGCAVDASEGYNERGRFEFGVLSWLLLCTSKEVTKGSFQSCMNQCGN
jgi:hypothetical protein